MEVARAGLWVPVAVFLLFSVRSLNVLIKQHYKPNQSPVLLFEKKIIIIMSEIEPFRSYKITIDIIKFYL